MYSEQFVVPDGGTATTLSPSSGQITVNIAPADSSSISHNTYTKFSVPNAGVTLDNSVVGAGIILNEVTSANITTIEGTLSVQGDKADIIVANPNGITVNGGRFHNTGNVALTTGSLGRNSSGQITSTVDAGHIEIGPGGLSGTMEELALISRSLRIDGAIEQDASDTASRLNLITGESVVSFDRDRPGGGILPWALATSHGEDSTDAILVDITRRSALSSGRISVTVTDKGAGVRIAGNHMAGAGGFRLGANGHLEINGVTLSSKGSVNIKSGSAELKSTRDNRTELSSSDSGVVLQTETGDLHLGFAKIEGAIIASDNLASSGGVTLLSMGRLTSNQSDTGQKAELIATDSHVISNGVGGIDFDGLVVTSAGDLRTGSTTQIGFSDVSAEVAEDFRALTNGALSFDASVISARNEIRLDASSIRFGANNVSQARTELVAKEGSFFAKTTEGDILNYGSLLQGRVASLIDLDTKGGMTLISARKLLNQSLSVKRLAVAFGQIEDLYVRAKGDVINSTGRLFSNANISIETEGDIRNETAFTDIRNRYSQNRYKGGRRASSLFLRRSRHLDIFADYGQQKINGERSFILGAGDVTLKAANVRNVGADITGANVDIQAERTFLNEARQIGKLQFSQKCRFFCKTRGSSTLSTFDSSLTASGQLSIKAGERITSIGGRMNAISGISFNAPLTEFLPTLSASLVELRSGLFQGRGGRGGYLILQNEFGRLRSFLGKIEFGGDVVLGDTDIQSPFALEVDGTQIRSKHGSAPAAFGQKTIGLFWNVF
ncbi:filamentous hemagglutinin N-terminal domain-containing protein [Roseovarius sp. EL26]|uniref:filamentous hemagglutinin N-terminal domain-containing protein n=1 Tax=Roseovarius sp. EL26 TaxID=2126672 RepID=UPI0013C4DBCE|nr:filamentous hemagglutinin N-terminal domain-containing protein [Roseovarius sp. EL26]